MMDELEILKAANDLITNSYDWLNNSSSNAPEKVQYMLGVHDLAKRLLEELNERGQKNGTENIDTW